MSNEEYLLQSPETVFERALKMPPKVNLRDYLEAMEALRDKGYSYREIADWLAEMLGVEINRGQVVYLLNAHPAALDMEAEQEQAEEDLDRRDEASIDAPYSITPASTPSPLPEPSPPRKAPRSRKKSKP